MIRKRRSSRIPEGSAIQWYMCESIVNLYSRRIKKMLWPYSRPVFQRMCAPPALDKNNVANRVMKGY